MIKKCFTGLGVLSMIVAMGVVMGLAQESGQDQEKLMEAYMKMGALNENHAFFKHFAGEWDVMTKAWMQPGAEPSVSKSTARAELILGGRFLKIEIAGSMFGQPFEGLQLVGYDNMKKKYNTLWIDSTSTAFFMTEGVRDEKTKGITETGNWADPMTGGTMNVRTQTTLVSEDEYVFAMFMVSPDGSEFKSVENISKRKK